MIQMSKEEMEKVAAMNRKMIGQDKDRYEIIQDLCMITVLARRIGHEAMADRAELMSRVLLEEARRDLVRDGNQTGRS